MPMPTATYCSTPVSPSTPISVRIPTSLRVSSTRSLVHLMPGRRPQMRSMARQAATAASAVTGSTAAGAAVGLSRAVRYSPLPGGDWKERPLRPRPPVCWPARITRPFSPPARAACLAYVLVESRVSKKRIRRPTTAVFNRAASASGSNVSGMERSRYPKRVLDSISYPSRRRASTPFQTAERVMPRVRLRCSPEMYSPLLAHRASKMV